MPANLKSTERLANQPAGLKSGISKFQQEIWNLPEVVEDEAQWEILRELACDLDFYEPDPKLRSEDPSFYGDDRALSEIRQALAKLAGR